MMQIKEIFLMSLLALLFTLLLVYDFFPNLNDLFYISKSLFIILMLVILLIGYFANRVLKDESPKFNLWCQVGFTSYLLALLVVLTLLDGASQVGISLSNPIVWILLVITYYDSGKEYKKLKVSKCNRLSS